MNRVVPTVTAYDVHEYRRQMECACRFSGRVHVDIMDGIFAPTKSPAISQLWLEKGIDSDIHVMYQHPDKQIKALLKLHPQMIIVQAEASRTSVIRAIEGLKKTKVKVGLGLLPSTQPGEVAELVARVDAVLIFSGHLGYHGGTADLSLLDKVKEIRSLNPTAEISWDGGIDRTNIRDLVEAGIEVLNTGGAIQKALDPAAAFQELQKLAAAK